MKFLNILFAIILLLLVVKCKPGNEDNPIIECSEGCTNLTELETRHDYFLPFSLINNNDLISQMILNNEPLEIPFGSSYQFTENGFYELILIYKDSSKENDTILFTTKTEERQFSEWGIKAWIPAPFETELIGNEVIEAVYPRFYTDSIKVPFIFYIKTGGNRKQMYLKANYSGSDTSFYIKNGVGSVNISASELINQQGFTIGSRPVSYEITKKNIPDYILSGVISENIEIPANSFVKITGDLNIATGVSLIFNEGTLVLVNPSVDINHSGQILFHGVESNPIFITCSKENAFWGGFLTSSPEGTLEAKYTIFCQSGYHNSAQYAWGHAQRQALFYTNNSNLNLNHCYMLDHIGQIFYPQNSTLTLNDILVQRVKTSGQINTSTLVINNSIFSDFPDDSRIYQDNDNDALYLSASNATINNSIFMFAKDDGLDSGNDDGGEIKVANTRFEACFHEGAALSSRNLVVKNHTFINCIFTNCGQGLELGFSSPNHSVIADNCIFLKNGIGVRYGDNYDWSYVDGKMFIKNSFCIDNVKDVWNMVRMDWKPKIDNLKFENTFITTYTPQYPDLKILSN